MSGFGIYGAQRRSGVDADGRYEAGKSRFNPKKTQSKYVPSTSVMMMLQEPSSVVAVDCVSR